MRACTGATALLAYCDTGRGPQGAGAAEATFSPWLSPAHQVTRQPLCVSFHSPDILLSRWATFGEHSRSSTRSMKSFEMISSSMATTTTSATWRGWARFRRCEYETRLPQVKICIMLTMPATIAKLQITHRLWLQRHSDVLVGVSSKVFIATHHWKSRHLITDILALVLRPSHSPTEDMQV